ncbi:MAG: hypothetical protein ACI9YE_000459 [Psychroserpens sp.]|jgi:hypothetical protein
MEYISCDKKLEDGSKVIVYFPYDTVTDRLGKELSQEEMSKILKPKVRANRNLKKRENLKRRKDDWECV